MIVRREQGFRADDVVNLLRDCPRKRNAVVRRSAAPHFVQHDERARRRVAQDVTRLAHLDEKRRATLRDVVARADARKDAVGQRDARETRGDETADLRHQHDQRDLPHEHALARHIRSRENDDALRIAIEPRVVRDECLALAQKPLDNRMTTFADFDHVAVVNNRLDVAVTRGGFSERRERVELREDARGGLQARGMLCDSAAHLREQIILQVLDAILRREDVRLLRFEFGRDVAFRV